MGSNCTVNALIQKGYLAIHPCEHESSMRAMEHPCEQWNSHAGDVHSDAIGHVPRVIAMRPANGKIPVRNDDATPSYGILVASRIDLDDTRSAQKAMRRLSERGRAAPLRITTALLAAAWVGTPGLSEGQPAQPDAPVSAAQNVDFGGAAGNDGFQTGQVSRRDDKSVQLAQKGTNDTKQSQQDLEQEHHRAEMLSAELATARHDVELLLKLLYKVRYESARNQRPPPRETAELRKSIQQERDRAGRLE